MHSVLPGVATNRPAAHGVQLADPAPLVYDPALHGAQLLAPEVATYVPASQPVHAAAPTPEVLPCAQAAQPLAPASA